MRKLGRVALVAVGLMALSDLPHEVLSVASYLGDSSALMTVASYVLLGLAAALTVVLGLGLVIFNRQLANRWFDEDGIGIAVSAEEMLRVVILVFGLSMAIEGLISVATAASAAALNFGPLFGGSDMGLAEAVSYWAGNLAYPLVQLLIGLGLLFAGRRVTGLLWSLGSGERSAYRQAPCESKEVECPHCGAPYDPDDYEAGVTHRCSNCHQELEQCV